MANADKTVKVQIVGDSSSFQKAASAAGVSAKDLQKGVDTLQSSLKKGFEGVAGNLGVFGDALGAIGPAGLAAGVALGAVGGAFVGVGAFVAGAIKGLTEYSDKLADLPAKSGLTLKFLQELQFAGSFVGVALEDSTAALTKMQKAITDGSTVFERLGLDLQTLRGLKPEDQFEAVAKAIVAIKDPAQQVTAAIEAFGKSGANILPLLKSDLAGARAEAERLGIVVGDDAVNAADNLGDSVGKLNQAWEAFKNQIAAAAITSGAFQDLLDAVISGVAELTQFAKDNRGIIKAIFEGAEGAAITALSLIKQIAQAASYLPFFQNVKGAFSGVGDVVAQINATQKALDEARAKREKEQADKGGDGKSKGFRSQKDIEEAQKYQDQVDKIAEAEKRATIEANKRFAAEDKAVAKANEEAAKRLANSAEAIFGFSKQSAVEAEFQFGLLQTALERAGKTIEDLSENDLKRYEEQLVKIEQATRGDADANAEVVDELGQVRNRLREVTDGFEKPVPKAQLLLSTTQKWSDALSVAAGILSDLGLDGLAGMIQGFQQVLGLTQQITAQVEKTKAATGKGSLDFSSKLGIAQAAVGIGVDAYKGASTNAKASVGRGVLGGAAKGALIGSVLPGVGTVIGGVVGGVIGGVAGFFGSKAKTEQLFKDLNKNLIDQFGSIDKAREAAKKYGIELDKALSSKKPEVLKKAIEDLGKAIEKEQQKIEGLTEAQGAVEQLQDAVVDSTNEKLKAAVQQLADKVSSEALKAGLGFAATGPLRQSEDFKAAQSVSGAASETVAGLRKAGVVDQGVIAAAGVIAGEVQKQALEAARAAGLSEQEAQKASFGAVADLLKEQLNASLASGQELDANTKALIEEARKNGIDILADPAIEAVAVAKDQLGVLREIAGKGAGSDNAKNAADAVREALRGVPGLASGGLVQSPTLAFVGEKGPEAIIPLSDLPFMWNRNTGFNPGGSRIDYDFERGGGGASPIVNQYFDINNNPFQTAETSRQTAEFVIETTRREVDRSLSELIAAGRA